MAIYYMNGAFVPEAEASLPVSDLIILRGYGVFDYLRTYASRPFHLDAHIRRLLNSAELVGIHCPWTFQEIKEVVLETLARNNFSESTIRILVTGGDSDDSITPGEKPRLLVMVNSLKAFPEQWYEMGVKVTTNAVTRSIPGAKSVDYIRGILGLHDARSAGAVESIYVDDRDRVLEGTTSNIFALIGGELVTPPDHILPGITRDVTLDIVRPAIATHLRSLGREELYQADEVFLSSSNKEIMPVIQVDGEVIGNGRPGGLTRQIMALFRAYTDNYADSHKE